MANAGPLQSDFEAVAQAAENGDGSCTATEAAILKTERDFAALPASVDAGLRNRLREGIAKLHSDALELCKQPLPQATVDEHLAEDDHDQPRTTTDDHHAHPDDEHAHPDALRRAPPRPRTGRRHAGARERR